MINIFEKLLDLIYIQPCYFCGSSKEDKIICSDCYKKIGFLSSDPARIVVNKKVYACCKYENIIKNAIHGLKYHKKKKLAKIIAKIMFDSREKFGLNENYAIIPVPIHKSRRKERGYNHTEIIAKEYAKHTGDTVYEKFLLRIKDTQKQYGLKTDERIKNITGAFGLNEKTENMPDKNSNILILDDIISTGATMSEMIRVLKENGYENITGYVLSMPDFYSGNLTDKDKKSYYS